MKKFKADLHIHTVLSPCADLEMTPKNIVKKAREAGLNLIGITDHNSTRNARLVKKIAEREGIFTLTGAEVTTREEVHCLVFFEQEDQLNRFQQFLDDNLIRIPNPDGHFGYQPVVDEQERVIELIPWFLSAALHASIQEVQQIVSDLKGLFIPAHVDRPANGLFSQLGFIPPGLKCDAFGLSRYGSVKDVEEQHHLEGKITFIRNSDAHFLKQIGEIYTVFNMEEMSFSEVRKALSHSNHRYVDWL
jgi:3',5'-nucleoside bisphosphate phosphatase